MTRRPPSPTERVALLVSHRITAKALAALIVTYTVGCLTASFCYDLNISETTNFRSRHLSPARRAVRLFPRVILYAADVTGDFQRTMLEGEVDWEPPKRNVTDMGDAEARTIIMVDDDLELDDVEDENCKLQYEWQKASFPTCNSVHEVDATNPFTKHRHGYKKQYEIMGKGYWRDVWMVNSEYGDDRGVYKTMRYEHDFTARNFERMRRDGVAMERLTESPYVIDIYSFCGTSSLSEFGDGGNIEDALLKNPSWSPIEKLRIGTFRVDFFTRFWNLKDCGTFLTGCLCQQRPKRQ
jgi:hypothetical protein